MDEGNLSEEIEVLEAIYIEELEVHKNDRDEVHKIILQLHPATGEDLEQRYVCMTLVLDLSPQYPHVPPEIMIKNPRGIAEEELLSLREDMHKLCEDRKGGPVLFELIELAKDSLTAGNIPHCPCMICLEHFHEGEKFTKTECYHYFHEGCLGRYVTHVLTKTPEIVPAHAEPSPDSNKLVCPVCREEIHYKFDDFGAVTEEDAFMFTPNKELRELQVKLAAVFERQKACGGIIDIEAEKNKYLVRNDDVVLLGLPNIENKQTTDRPRSGNGRYERVDEEKMQKILMTDDRDYDIKRQEGNRIDRRPNSSNIRGRGRGRRFNDGKGYRDRDQRERWRENAVDKSVDDTKRDKSSNMTNETEVESNEKDKMKSEENECNDGVMKEKENKEISDSKQSGNISNSKGIGGGFGKPPDKRFNRGEKYENREKSAQNDKRYRRGGFGRPDNNFRADKCSDNKRRENRGGFGRPRKNDHDNSKDRSAVPSTSETGKQSGIEKKSIDQEIANSDTDLHESRTFTPDITGNEGEKHSESYTGKDEVESVNDRAICDNNSKTYKGRLDRQSVRNDGKIEKYGCHNNSDYEREGTGKPEKKYGSKRTDGRKDAQSFGRISRDITDQANDMSEEGTDKIADPRKNSHDKYNPRVEDNSKSDDRHGRDSDKGTRYTGNGREESRNYSREGRFGKETRNMKAGDKYIDRYKRSNRDFRDSNDYHRQNRFKHKRENAKCSKEGRDKRHQLNNFREDVKGSACRNRGFHRKEGHGSQTGEGDFRSENDYKNNKNRGNSSSSLISEHKDSCTDSALKKFDSMSISGKQSDDNSIQQRETDVNVKGKSEVCDKDNGADKMKHKVDEKRGGPPGFAVSPPPGFKKTEQDSKQLVQPPPGFS